jgi:methyl-accepting chemotaxis protein
MQFKNVRTKFLVILLPLFILSFFVLSGISYYLANAALLNDAHKIASGLGNEIAADIRSEMLEPTIRLDDLAKNQGLQQGDATSKAAILSTPLVSGSNVAQYFYSDLNGKALRNDGKVLDRGDREYIKIPQQTKKPYIAKPFMGESTGKLMTMMTRPVFVNNQLTGFVLASINLDSLSKLVENVSFFKTGYAYLADSSGLVIGYSRKPELVGKMDLSQKKVEGVGELDDRLVQAFKTAMESNTQTAADYRSTDGVENIAIITPIELDGRTWAVVAAAPQAEVEAESAVLFKIMMGISLLAVILAIFVIFIFAKKVTTPIIAIRDECDVLNSGDLRQNDIAVEAQDEIGQLAKGFDSMRQTLRNLIRKVQDQTEQVAAAGEELTASAEQSAQASNQVAISITNIAEGVERQSQAATQIRMISEKINNHAQKLTEKTQGIAQDAKATTDQVGSGRASIAKVVSQMEQITLGTQTIETSIGQLAKGSDEIGHIVELISNIAGQTNLLALNAAIEAARAGEAGRGFAVVAEEVRKLAEESERSSQQIAALVQKNHEGMKNAVEASQKGSENVRMGIDTVKSADEVFKAIVTAIEKLSTEIISVSSAIHDMSKDNASMMLSIRDIEQISNKNADDSQSVSAATEEQSASMEEIATASQNLAKLAADLQTEVSRFKV